MSKLENLYLEALEAARKMPATERRRTLEEMAWDSIERYGQGDRHGRRSESEGERYIYVPKRGLVPMKDATDDELRHLAMGDGSPLYVFKRGIKASDLIKKKVTIYKKSEIGMGHNAIEASAYYAQVRPYAQHQRAFQFVFIPKASRNMREFYETRYPSLLVLEGWGHPKADELVKLWNTVSEGPHVSVMKGRHMSFSSEWQNEFDQAIEAYAKTKKVKVLIDLR